MAWYNDWNDFTDAVSDGYDYAAEEISDGYDYVSGKVSDGYDYATRKVSEGVEMAQTKSKEAMKALNRETIKHVYAPIRKGEKDDIKTNFGIATVAIAIETMANLKIVANKMEESIQGKLSKAISKTMEEKASGYLGDE